MTERIENTLSNLETAWAFSNHGQLDQNCAQHQIKIIYLIGIETKMEIGPFLSWAKVIEPESLKCEKVRSKKTHLGQGFYSLLKIF